MSWGIAAAWLAVLGLILLTAGAGAQAWASLAEFRSLKQTASTMAVTALSVVSVMAVRGGPRPRHAVVGSGMLFLVG